MADCGEKLVFHAARHLGLPSRLTRFLERLRSPPLEDFLFRDIARDLGSSDNSAAAVPNGGYRQRYVNNGAVFPSSFGLEIIDALSPPDSACDLVFFAGY